MDRLVDRGAVDHCVGMGFVVAFDVISNSRGVYLLNMVMMIKQSMEQVPAMIAVMFDVGVTVQVW